MAAILRTATLLVALLLLPAAVAATDVTVAAGSTTFATVAYQEDAAVAGQARTEVTWLGGHVLFTQPAEPGAWVLAVPAGAALPAIDDLRERAESRTVVDPEDAATQWRVQRLWHGDVPVAATQVGALVPDDWGGHNFILLLDAAMPADIDLHIVAR